MAIGMKCPKCGKAFTAKVDPQGAEIPCPVCKTPLAVAPPQKPAPGLALKPAATPPPPWAGQGATIPVIVKTAEPAGRGPLVAAVVGLLVVIIAAAAVIGYLWVQRQRLLEQHKQAAAEPAAPGAPGGKAPDRQEAKTVQEGAEKKVAGPTPPQSEAEAAKSAPAAQSAKLQELERQLDQTKVGSNVRRLKEEGDGHLTKRAHAAAIAAYKAALLEIEKLDGKTHPMKEPIRLALAEAEQKAQQPSVQSEPSKQALETAKLVELYSKAVVVIKVFDKDKELQGEGTGFIVDPSGVIITCYHVIAGMTSVSVKTSVGDFPALGLLGYSHEKDLAVLKINGQKLPTVPLGSSDSVRVGEKVVVIGNPLGLESTVSEGIISALRTVEGRKIIQITAPISPGNSGGPLFLNTGEVAGVVNATLLIGQNLNFAIPINEAKPLVKPGGQLVAFSALPKVSEKVPDAKRGALLRDALGAIAGRKFRTAIELLNKALAANPRDVGALCLLGQCYLHTNALPQAKTCYERALTLDEDLVAAHLGLGWTLYRMGMHDNALPCFLKAIQLEPKGDEIAEAHAGLAAVMLAKKNFEGAIQAAKKAVDADPKNYSARLMLGAAHLARGNTEKAITELRKAVAIEGQEPEAHYMLGLAYRTARYFDFAQSEYDKLKKLDGELAAKLLQAIRTR